METKNNEPVTYNAAYFIAKFEAIPEELWCAGSFSDNQGRCCAYGHLRARKGEPSFMAIQGLLDLCIGVTKHIGTVVTANDKQTVRYPQETPKQRVLAWLRDAKKAGL